MIKEATQKKATSEKVASKKVVAKRVSPSRNGASKPKKKSAQKTLKPLVRMYDDRCFWMNDGTVLQDLAQLRDALNRIDEQVFSHHVTDVKNDFADWVEFVLDDAKCAQALRSAGSSKKCEEVVARSLRLYHV